MKLIGDKSLIRFDMGIAMQNPNKKTLVNLNFVSLENNEKSKGINRM